MRLTIDNFEVVMVSIFMLTIGAEVISYYINLFI